MKLGEVTEEDIGRYVRITLPEVVDGAGVVLLEEDVYVGRIIAIRPMTADMRKVFIEDALCGELGFCSGEYETEYLD